MQRLADVEHAAAFGTQQPLVAVSRKRVDVALAHVQRKCAEPLDSVDKVDAATAPADFADLLHGRAIAAEELHEADGKKPRAAAGFIDAVE